MNAHLRGMIGVVGLFCVGAAPAPDGADDPVFQAMDAEVTRATTLKMDGMDVPYYVAATSDQVEAFHVRAEFGELVYRQDDQQRALHGEVRVGGPELDNTNFVDRDSFSFEGHGVDQAPVEPNVDALRQVLWLDFDHEYKRAAEVIAKKRGYLKTNTVNDRTADFAPAKVTTLIQPFEKLKVDRERWTRLVKRASAVFREHSATQVGEVALDAEVSHQHFLNSEGFRHRFAEARLDLSLRAKTQAPDGMPVEAITELHGRTEADLPSEEQLLKLAQKTAAQLDALTRAPALAEDYTGPVLFTGRAAASFFLAAVGDSLSHPRDALGSPSRGRMTERLNKHVASKLLTVRDDPTQRYWKGQPLLGYFPIDDDSVKPEPITLIDHGVLKTYFMSRIPTKQVSKTNGHSRAGQGSMANLFVEGAKPQSRAQLKKALLELAADEDLEYGILVDQIEEEPYSRSGRDGSLSLPPPLLAYRVYKDGREELVRGANFKTSSSHALKDVVALGNEPTLLNTHHQGQWVSVVAPAVLVKNLELGKPEGEFDKPPFSPRPTLSAASK